MLAIWLKSNSRYFSIFTPTCWLITLHSASGPVSFGNVVDTADNAVGTFHQRIADDGGQHDAMGTGVQGHNDDTIGIPQVMGFAGPFGLLTHSNR